MEFITLYIILIIGLFYYFIYKKINSPSQKKTTTIFLVVLAIYATITSFLSVIWYTQNQVPFHWFDDSNEWLFLDKLGHFFTAAAWSRFAISLFLFAGLDKVLAQRRMVWLGFILLSSVEWFDGLSANYGASIFDIIANFLGSLFIYIQYRYFSSMRLFSKWSYWPNNLAILRPNILGGNSAEQILKNYNGHIYWFSTPIYQLLKIKRIPHWLCISIGYGGEGMIGGNDNIYTDVLGGEKDYTNIVRYSQIYISMDIVIQSKDTYQPWQKSILFLLSLIKFPCPAIEFNTTNGYIFHWIAV